MKKRHEEKLVILSIVLFILFNAPVLLLFNTASERFGLPAIYIYIFSIWLASIIVPYIIFKKFDE